MIRPGHIEIFVSDPAASAAFYREVLGFVVTVPPKSSQDVAWLQLENLEMLLRPGQHQTPATSYQTAAAAIVLYTEDLEATAELWRSRGLAFRGGDGPGCLTFTDPDGHWFQLVNPETH